jgi:hypothetical protein
MPPRQNLAAGLIVGAVSGLAASWLMLRFIQGPGFRLQEALKSSDEHYADTVEAAHRQQHAQPEPETVTMQAADVFASHAPGGRHLSRDEKEQAATVVHYTFGAAMGVAYGIAAEYTPLPTFGLGALFGAVLWSATDLWSVPAVGFAKWPKDEPAAAHLSHLLAHLVYGSAMETTRRLLRP